MSSPIRVPEKKDPGVGKRSNLSCTGRDMDMVSYPIRVRVSSTIQVWVHGLKWSTRAT